MDDEAAICRTCGAALEGRDVYEGICKTCREEAVLGSSAPPPQPKHARRPPLPPPASAPPHPLPDDAIAIETSVDLDADTREIPSDDEPSEPADASPAPSGLALDEEPKVSPRPPQVPPPAQPPEKAPESDDLPVLKFDAAPPSSEATGRPPLAIETASPPPHRPPPALKRLPPSRDPEVEDAYGEGQPKAQPLHITPREPQPTFTAPAGASPSNENREPLALDTDSVREEPPAPAKPPAEPERDLPVLEAAPRECPRPRRTAPAEPEAAGPAPLPSRGRKDLQLDTDTAAGNLRGLLGEMQGQVEQLSKVLSTAHRVAPSAFWFGFRACFGFVLGMGVLAAVVLGLMALIGVLFYPPAFELVRQVLHSLGLP